MRERGWGPGLAGPELCFSPLRPRTRERAAGIPRAPLCGRALGRLVQTPPPPPPRRRVSPGQLCGRLAEGWALGPPMELPSPPLPSPSRVECQPGWGRPGCSPGLRGQRREVRLQSKPGRVPSDLARGIAGAGRGNPGGGAGQPSSLGLCLVHHGPNYPEELKG